MSESQRPDGLDDLLNYVAASLHGTEALHHPMLVRWDNRHTLPAEVCDTCSDPASGTWVPVPFCELARAKLQADPDCAYSYGVIARRADDNDNEEGQQR